MELELIPVNRIHPNPYQPREAFDDEKLSELKESIKESGLIQPITVRRKGLEYEIVAGERRWRAHMAAGIKEIPAILQNNISDLEMQELSLIENWHRVNLESIEAEKFLWKLWKDGSGSGRYKSYADMAKKVGMKEGTLSIILRSHQDRLALQISPDLEKLSYRDFSETAQLRQMPEVRKQLLEMKAHGKLLDQRNGLRALSGLLKENPDVSQKIIEFLGAGASADAAKDAIVSTMDLKDNAEIRQQLISLQSEERIRRDEMPILAKVLKENPDMAKYAMQLKARGESVEDVKRSVEQVKAKPEAMRRDLIEAGVVFKEDPAFFRVEVPLQQREQMRGQLAEFIKAQDERDRDPAFQEAKKRRLNLEGHLAISQFDDIFCPKCGRGHGKLIWSCCGTDIKTSLSRAKENFEKRVNT